MMKISIKCGYLSIKSHPTSPVFLALLNADGDGANELAGDDRVSASFSAFEEDAAGWWRVTASAVWPEAGSAACLTASVTRVRMTGLGAPAPSGLGLPAGARLTAQTEALDWRGNVTRVSTCTDAEAAAVWTVTETPESVQPAVQKTVAGHAVSMVSSTVMTNTYAYDGFGRPVSATDGRSNTSLTAYNGLGQVIHTEDAASNRTAYAYDGLGRRTEITDALSNTIFTAYDSTGNVTAQWGATYPVAYEHDTAGRKIAMATTRDSGFDFSTVTNSSILPPNSYLDVTRWFYDHATGLLTNKVYADGSRVVYAYAADGRLASRTWARGVTAVYAYDAFGQVTNTAYSDDTPQVSYAYDRLGRVLSAVTGRSPSQFLIEELLPYLPPLATNIFSYSGLDLASETQNGVTVARRRDALGRDTGYGIGDGVSAAYGYDAFGRFASVTSAFHAATNVFTYGYLQGTDLINRMTNSAGIMWQRAHEQNRGLVTAVSNRFNQSLISAFDYGNEALGRRARRVDRTASLLATNDFAYNARGEITGAGMGGDSYGYGYDSIGNRVWSAENAATNLYAANALNQYTAISNQQSVISNPTHDADGNLTSCTLPDGVWVFSWDGENRLAAAERLTFDASGFRIRVRNVYDHRSRRVAKQLQRRYYREDGGMLLDEIRWGLPAASARRVWDGWNIVAETAADAVAGTTNAAFYTWGPDLSGTLQGAGGVGGLLAETKTTASTTNTYCALGDANGNVTEYLSANGTVVAHYEYSPFGEIAAQSGDMADSFTHRFSTKPFDAETGLAMYQLRPYSPPLGRWLSRDPLGDEAFLRQYTSVMNRSESKHWRERSQRPTYLFVQNNPLLFFDYLGLDLAYSGCKCCPGIDDAVRRVNRSFRKGTCKEWFEEHGHNYSAGTPRRSVACHGNWKIPCMLGFPAWTMPGMGIGVCNSRCEELGSVALASLLVHELAHHYCTYGPGRENCAISAQEACSEALMD